MHREKCGPFNDQDTDVTVSAIPRSQSLVTFELFAFHKYTLEDRPTAKKFWVDQSIKFK